MGNYLRTNQDHSKIFLGDNKYDTESYINNSSYNPITLQAGTVMGRIASSGVLVPCIVGANNGSQYPIGILADDMEIDAGVTTNATICVAGDVTEDKLIFWDGVLTINTVIENQRIKDHLQYAGIILRARTEMTSYDN